MYTLLSKDKNTLARRGVLKTSHGDLHAPFFMPVATNGTIKSLSCDDLEQINAQISLSNTYHLYLRPGMEVISHWGGLHDFMSWKKPILTDSGGYQVFSLSKLRKLRDEGADFQSHLDGSRHLFTPESVVDIQKTIGTDIMMPLDVCAPYPCGEQEAKESVRLTTLWAKRSRQHFLENPNKIKQYQFGIVQGATYKHLREQSAEEILNVDFDGYAIGGVSVGEPVKDMFESLDWVVPYLPEEKPRYFMGIGLPDQIVKAVGRGIDMFDTVLPTRVGRHATAFTKMGRKLLRNAEFIKDEKPIDPHCKCHVCQKYSRSYIRHLAVMKEFTAMRLISYHNLYFYVNLMSEIRQAIEENNYESFQNEFFKNYNSEFAVK